MYGPAHPQLKVKAVHQTGGMLPAGIYSSAQESHSSRKLFAILRVCMANMLPGNKGKATAETVSIEVCPKREAGDRGV